MSNSKGLFDFFRGPFLRCFYPQENRVPLKAYARDQMDWLSRLRNVYYIITGAKNNRTNNQNKSSR